MRLLLSAWLVALGAACSGPALRGALNELGGDGYPLDDRSRETGPDAGCPQVELATYSGTRLRYRPAVRVTPPFAARLPRFEQAVERVAQQTYGRPPAVVRHAGAYVCRPVRSSTARRWSEHAFGNAIDVIGFDFERAPRVATTGSAADGGVRVPPAAAPPLPAALRRRFSVRVATHWQAKPDAASQLHQRFLRELAALLAREDVFRGLIGPPDPLHRTHLHCDMAPWQYRNL